jgi:hypothetical protein
MCIGVVSRSATRNMLSRFERKCALAVVIVVFLSGRCQAASSK